MTDLTVRTDRNLHGGRGSRCTPEAIHHAEVALRAGASWSMVAGVLGVSVATVHRWRADGARGVQPYREFYDRTTRARSIGALELLDVVGQAARGGDWHAAAWILSRRFGMHTPEVEAGLPTVVDGGEGRPAEELARLLLGFDPPRPPGGGR